MQLAILKNKETSAAVVLLVFVPICTKIMNARRMTAALLPHHNARKL